MYIGGKNIYINTIQFIFSSTEVDFMCIGVREVLMKKVLNQCLKNIL